MHSECLGRYVAHGHEHTGGVSQRQGSVALEPSGAVGPVQDCLGSSPVSAA